MPASLAALAAVFAGLAVAVVVLGSILAERREVQRSLHAVATLSSGGGGAVMETPSFRQRVAIPALDRFTSLGRRLTPTAAADKLVKRLDLAGNPAPWTVDRILAVKAACALASFVLGLLLFTADKGLLRAVLLSLPVALALFCVPDVLLVNMGNKRQTKIQSSLADALDLLTITVEAGMGFDAALNQVARNVEGPLSGEFFRVLQEMQMKSRTDALRALGDRTTVVDLRTFVSSLVQADKLGIPIAQVLREQSKEMRLKRRQRAEEQAMKVPVKLLFPTVVCILPVLFIVVLAPSFMELKSIL